MLQAIPASSLPHEWETIGPALSRAIELDPERDAMRVLGQGLAGELRFWRVGGSVRGFVVTQVYRAPKTIRKALWVIYAEGTGGSLADKRELMKLIEDEARKAKCSEVKFEGRDWRKVVPGYSANQTADGRWHFRRSI